MRGISHSFPERAATPSRIRLGLGTLESSGVGGDCRMPRRSRRSLTSVLDGSTRYVDSEARSAATSLCYRLDVFANIKVDHVE